jgi:ketosteroid isomerase-like protein
MKFKVLIMSPDKEKDEAAIKEWVESMFFYMGSNDLESFTSLMAEDIIFLPPNMNTIYGLEATKKLIQPWFETLNMTHEISETEIMIDSNLAYVRIEYKDRNWPKGGGETTLMDNKGLWILRREIDNTWKMTRCMWNRNPPAE